MWRLWHDAATVWAEEIDGTEKIAGEVGVDGGKSDRMVFQSRGDLQNLAFGWLQGHTVPLAMGQWYNFHKVGCNLGNVD
jgi:hypothetical protein